MSVLSNRWLSSAALAIALAAAVPSQQADAATATFNFGALATSGAATGGTPALGVGEGTWDSFIALAGGYTVGGISVGATATNIGALPGVISKAYLDSPSGGPAGLGVCSTGGGSGCAGSPDDNTGLVGDTGPGVEKLTLTFDAIVNLTSLTFKDRDHKSFFGKLDINGATYFTNAAGVLDIVALAGLLSATVFDFTRISDPLYAGELDFYVQLATAVTNPGGGGLPPVPLPPALILFASALVGLGILGRRRRKPSEPALQG